MAPTFIAFGEAGDARPWPIELKIATVAAPSTFIRTLANVNQQWGGDEPGVGSGPLRHEVDPHDKPRRQPHGHDTFIHDGRLAVQASQAGSPGTTGPTAPTAPTAPRVQTAPTVRRRCRSPGVDGRGGRGRRRGSRRRRRPGGATGSGRQERPRGLEGLLHAQGQEDHLQGRIRLGDAVAVRLPATAGPSPRAMAGVATRSACARPAARPWQLPHHAGHRQPHLPRDRQGPLATSNRAPSSASSRARSSALRCCQAPEARSARSAATARSEIAGPRRAHTDEQLRTFSSR